MTAFPRGWTLLPLGNLLTRITYGFTNPMPTTTQGPYLVTAKDVRDGRIDYNSARHTDSSAYTDLLTDKSRPNMGDILLTKDGSIGRVAVVDRPEICINQSVALLQLRETVDSRFLAYLLQAPFYQERMAADADGSTIKHIYITRVDKMSVAIPSISEQREIAATLGALDDKIESNRRACRVLRELGQALVTGAGVAHTSRLRDVASSIARGVTPKYADDDPDSPLVVNQKCVRDGGVSLTPARRMVERQVAAEKRASSGDVLVNSTGAGTLGRVGRWHTGDVFADSHVSIVKADTAKIGATLLAYLMFTREVDIEGMATGSTGQTELSPSRLGDLVLDIPGERQMKSLEPILLSSESRSASFEVETTRLTQMRDTLLPELMSGRIRVPEAHDAVAETAVSV